MSVMHEDTFYEKFQPIEKPDGSPFWELEEIRAAGVPADRVWSVMDGENSSTLVAPGYHAVNVFAWMVTQLPYTESDVAEIDYVDFGRGGDLVELRHEEAQALATLLKHTIDGDPLSFEAGSSEEEDFMDALEAALDVFDELLRAVTK